MASTTMSTLRCTAVPALALIACTAAFASAQTFGAIGGHALTAAAQPLGSNTSVVLYDASGARVTSTTPLSGGSYSFTVPFGTYFVRTETLYAGFPFPGPGVAPYVDQIYSGVLCPIFPSSAAPSCAVTAGTPVTVSAGTPAQTVDFALPIGATIAGTVHGISSPVFLNLYAGSTFLEAAVPDSSGNYTFNGLPPGSYFVRTRGDTVVDQWWNGVCIGCVSGIPTPIVVSALGAAVTGIDFTLTSGAAIAGTLTLETLPFSVSAAIPQIQVYDAVGNLVKTIDVGVGDVGPLEGPFAWSAQGLPAGAYYVRTFNPALPFVTSVGHTLPGVTAGYWVDELYGAGACVATDCRVTSGTPVVVNGVNTTSGIAFSLKAGARITGDTHSGFAPNIDVYDSRGVLLPNRVAYTNFIAPNLYFAAGLPPGTYYLLRHRETFGASTEQVYDGIACNGCAVTFGTPIVVGAAEQKTGIDFQQLTGNAISGTVRSSSAVPLGTITVTAFTVAGNAIASAVTATDGTYRIDALAPGTYSLRASNTRGFLDATISTVVTAGTDTTRADIVLAQGQTISGQVLAGGGPVTGAGLLIYTTSPASPAAHVSTDSFGGFRATIPAGSYFAQTDPVSGFAQQIYNGAACPRGSCPTAPATQITVASTPVTNVNFNLPACPAPVISPLRLANAAVGTAYWQTLLVSGTNGAARFTVSSGALPPGLSLDSATGVMSGTATATGQFTFTVSAIDATACAGSRTYTLDVPPCPFTVAPGPPTARASGGPWFALLSGTCGTFTVTPNVSWLTVQAVGSSGVSGTMTPNTGGPRQGTVTIGPRTITIFQPGAVASPPFGSVDAPADGAVVAGSVGISGWALHDLGVIQVTIYRDPVGGEPAQLIFVGKATFVPGARPDVEAAFPTLPFNNSAGWGYLLLTNMLPNHGNGTFRFSIFADDLDLNHTLIGTKLINVVNASATAPFGAIDTPDQGATVSGTSYVNFGWSLTPQPKMIPFDGSTIHVLIDGVDVGTVNAYNLFRPDVSGLFPSLKNSSGPVGYRMIDTTALSEGTHTIAWVATDDGGMTTGIGSRYFTVSNSAWQPLRANFAVVPPAVSASELAPTGSADRGVSADRSTAVPARVDGVDLGRKAESLASLPVDATGARMVQMANLQGLELSLTAGAKRSTDVDGAGLSADTCAATYAGYLVVNGDLRALPVGSSLDPAGTFYWHPGPGFFGTYHLLFVRTACDGAQQRIPVSIQVR